MILSLDKASDEQLLHAMAGEDMEALGELYRRHESRVYHYLVIRLNDSAAAADLFNDVMLDVWRGAARFAGRSKVTTWMLGIAHHKVRNHWRRQGSGVFTEVDDPQGGETGGPDLEKALAAAQDAERLRDGLDKLSEAHRELMYLAFFEELDEAGIAMVMGVPEVTVKPRVHHARHRLQWLLAHTVPDSSADARADNAGRVQETDFVQALRSGLQNRPIETPPGELGLARLKQDIAHNRVPQPIRRRANLWKPLALAASVLVAIQASLLIGNDPWQEARDTNLAPVPDEPSIAGPRLNVVFDGSTSLSELQIMLQTVNARLVDGPNALGIWALELPDGTDVQAVREQLQASQGVEEVIAL